MIYLNSTRRNALFLGQKCRTRVLRLLAKAIAYLYANSRPQFHPALYVLLYSGSYVVLFWVFLFLISLIPGMDWQWDWELLGMFVGCVALGELTRGHIRHWLGTPVEIWCFRSMAFGGYMMGLTFWGLIALEQGAGSWYAPLVAAMLGAAFYVLIGWLLRKEAEKSAHPGGAT